MGFHARSRAEGALTNRFDPVYTLQDDPSKASWSKSCYNLWRGIVISVPDTLTVWLFASLCRLVFGDRSMLGSRCNHRSNLVLESVQ